jgi:hypothetical protein
VEEDYRRTIGGAGFSVSNTQEAGIDLLQRAERCVRPRLNCGHIWWGRFSGLRFYRTEDAELGGGNGHGRIAQKVAAVIVDFFRHLDLL